MNKIQRLFAFFLSNALSLSFANEALIQNYIEKIDDNNIQIATEKSDIELLESKMKKIYLEKELDEINESEFIVLQISGPSHALSAHIFNKKRYVITEGSLLENKWKVINIKPIEIILENIHTYKKLHLQISNKYELYSKN